MDKTNKDWRLDPYGGFLDGKTFCLKNFISSEINDHEHCYFCWQKITDLPIEDSNHEGYSTIDSKTGQEIWVCQDCFNDFEKQFNFKVR